MFYTAKQIGFTKIRSADDRIQARKTLSNAELDLLLQKNWSERFEYCMETSVKHHEVWTIWSDGGLEFWQGSMSGMEDEVFYTPVFPHQELGAAFCRNTQLQNPRRVPIPLDDFIDEIVPQLDSQNAYIGVFPETESDEVIIIGAGDFVSDLRGAWEHVYNTELEIDPLIQEEYIAYCADLVNKRLARNN